MSELKKINEEFEKSMHGLVEERLDMRHGEVIVVRRYPAPNKMPTSAYRSRQDKLSLELLKNFPKR